MINAVIVSVCIAILTAVFLVWRRTARQVRVIGIGFLAVRAIGLVTCDEWDLWPPFYWDEWNLAERMSGDFRKLIRRAKLSVSLMGVKVRWEGRKLVLSAQSANILISPPSRIEDSPTQPVAPSNPPSTIIVKAAMLLLEVLLRTFRFFWMVRIEQVNIVFTQFPRQVAAELKFWNALSIRMSGISLFGKGGEEVCIEGISGTEVFYAEDAEVETPLVSRAIVQVPQLKLFWPMHGHLRLEIAGEDSIKVDLWPTTLLLITSAVAETNKRAKTGDKSQLDLFLSSKSPLLLSIGLGRLSVSLHLPVVKEEMRRFESLNVDAFNLQACCSARSDAESPFQFLVASEAASVSSTGANEFGATVMSKMQRLFEAALGSLQGSREQFLKGSSIVLSNCVPTGDLYDRYKEQDQVLPIELVAEWIDALVHGRPVWSISNDEDDSKAQREYKELMSHVQRIIPSSFNCDQFTSDRYTNLPGSSLLLRLSNLSFDVPFEYPLSNLFDHLAYFVKIVQSPVPKESDRQDFNLFEEGRSWKLLVQADRAAFNIADSPFEARLAKCMHLKQLIYGKFDRMDRLFWKQCDGRDTTGKNEDGWVPMQLRRLAAASEHPEVLKGNPFWAKRYGKLQEIFFSLYKAHIQEELSSADEAIKPLLHVGGNNINFSVCWDSLFNASKGAPTKRSMSDILSSMEGDAVFSEEEVNEFGVFLGGFLDMSAEQLSVTLRDYSVPLCHAEAARMMGLVFLIEEPSYANAKSVNHIKAVRGDFPDGRWNLRGLDEQRRARITRTILPMKIYHSLQVSLAASDQPVLAGFSPLMEGAFQMLDRSFELFSKPSEELSPSLPFWDKLRLLLRGSTSSLKVNTNCRLVGLAGTDLQSNEEAISIVFPQGLTLGLDGSRVRLKVPQAVAYLNSEQESLLRWLHRTVGASFCHADLKRLRAVDQLRVAHSGHNDDDLPIIAFPSLDFEISFAGYGREGARTIPHNAIRICAASAVNLPDDADYDSYRFFRIHRLMISIKMRTLQKQSAADSHLLLFYYRELEGWFARSFGRFVTPPVMPGRLFQFGTLRKVATPKLLSVLSDIKLDLSYDGFFCVRGLQYYDTKDFGGALLSSQGRTRISLAWKKGGGGTTTSALWFLYFAEYDFSNMRLGIIGVDVAARDNDKKYTEPLSYLKSRDFPIKYEGGVAIYDVLTAPRLFYIVINEGCFKGDPESAATQRRTIETHLAALAGEIDILAVSLRKCDPHDDVNKFAAIKRELAVLLEQNEYIAKFATKEEGRPLVNNHHIIIQNARLLWHRHVRDALFSLVDQQFQFSRCAQAIVNKAIRLLEWEARRSSMAEAATHSRDQKTSSPASPASPGATAGSEALFEALISQVEGPLEVEHENLDEKQDQDMFCRREDQLADPAKLHGDAAYVSLRLDVNFVHPQIIFLDETTTDEAVNDGKESCSSAIIVTAQSAGLCYGTVRQSEYGEIVGRRTKIVLENALFHGAFQRDFLANSQEWPPYYPVEYLLSSETEAKNFLRLSEKVRVAFVYDVSNKRLKYNNSLGSPVRRLFGQGDKLRVDAGVINLLTTSELYAALYSVIVGLLVYRDPTQKMRSEQLESLMLATNIFNQAEITKTIFTMQAALLKRKRHVEGMLRRTLHRGSLENPELVEEYARLKAPWDELALVVDAMHTVRASQDRFRQKQTRLLLDVMIRKIQWTVFQSSQLILCDVSIDGIHDSWLSAEDGCQSNLVEIRTIKAINKLPDAFYKTLIAPVSEEVKALLHSEMGFRGIGTQGNSVRFFFKARPPVGGIRIIEHLELNLAPLQFQLTYDIAEELIKFFFPERKAGKNKDKRRVEHKTVDDKENSDSDADDAPTAEQPLMSEIKSGIRTTATSFLSHFGDRLDDHDVELMKARAADNCSFIYITVPASQHLISYKGRGESSITDVESFVLRLPDFEYHSQILSWLEFFLKLRKDSISVVLSNIGALVKDKIKRFGQANVPETEREASTALARAASRIGPSAVKENSTSKEAQERKAKMLLGKSYHQK